MNVNWEQIKGDWTELLGKVKERWGKLTDNELTVAAGKREQLTGLLQQRYGLVKEQAEKELDAFFLAMKPHKADVENK